MPHGSVETGSDAKERRRRSARPNCVAAALGIDIEPALLSVTSTTPGSHPVSGRVRVHPLLAYLDGLDLPAGALDRAGLIHLEDANPFLAVPRPSGSVCAAWG